MDSRVPDIVTVMLQHQQQDCADRRYRQVSHAGLVVQTNPQRRVELVDHPVSCPQSAEVVADTTNSKSTAAAAAALLITHVGRASYAVTGPSPLRLWMLQRRRRCVGHAPRLLRERVVADIERAPRRGRVLGRGECATVLRRGGLVWCEIHDDVGTAGRNHDVARKKGVVADRTRWRWLEMGVAGCRESGGSQLQCSTTLAIESSNATGRKKLIGGAGASASGAACSCFLDVLSFEAAQARSY